MEYIYDRSRHFDIPKYFYFEAKNSTVGGRNTFNYRIDPVTIKNEEEQEIVIDTNYAMPKFEDATAVLVDINAINGKFNSFIRLTNYSKFPDIKFDVFVHSPLTSTWELLGNAMLPGFEAEVDLGKKFPNLSLYRYFAIVPKSDSKSEYQYKMEKKMGRLDVSIFTKGVNTEEKPLPFHKTPFAYVFTDFNCGIAGDSIDVAFYENPWTGWWQKDTSVRYQR